MQTCRWLQLVTPPFLSHCSVYFHQHLIPPKHALAWHAPRSTADSPLSTGIRHGVLLRASYFRLLGNSLVHGRRSTGHGSSRIRPPPSVICSGHRSSVFDLP